MSEKRQPTVLGSLPHTRPHRRSAKRADVEPEATVTTAASEAAAAATKPKVVRATTKTPAAPKTAAKAKAPRAAPKAASAKPKLATAKTAAAAPARAASAKSAPRPKPKPAAKKTPPAKPVTARPSAPEPASNPGAMETAVQAAAELAEIGLQASARALRRTLSRLPRP